MTGSTINYGHPYPEGGDQVAVHSDIERLAKSVDAKEQAISQATEGAIPYRGWLDQFSAPLESLEDGRYGIRYIGTAEAFGLPQPLLGDLIVESSGTINKTITYRPNDAGSGFGEKYEWVISTNSGGTLRDRWQRLDKGIMRTAPVVVTSPAGDYPQAVSRGAVRFPFTVPTGVGRVRVHMRPWNFRTREEWGPARLSGVMISTQAAEGRGTITGSRWYAPNVDGVEVSGSAEWVSDWFNTAMVEGQTYILSYGAEWLDDSRNLVSGKCWSNADVSKWDSTEDAIYQNGWGGFTLNPMDVWIECEAPSTVPVWGYFDSSNGVFAGSESVFGAYPQVHARKNKVFAATTAAGGWSPMDDTFMDADIINRFGYPARMLDRLYLSMGANIEARGASAQDAIPRLETWMTARGPALGNPPIYLLTQISRDTSTETTDLQGTLSDWNEWIRYTATKRDDVKGLIDQAAIFQDPEKPWTARVELRESPGDVHFSAMGQKLRAQALDGEVTLPLLTAKDADDVPWRVGFEWAGVPNASQSVMKAGDREVRRNLYTDPRITRPESWTTGDVITAVEWDSSWTGNSAPSGLALSGEGAIHGGINQVDRLAVSPGQKITVAANLATPPGFDLRLRIYWYNNGSFVGATDAPNQGSSGDKVFTRVSVTGTVPAEANQCGPYFWLYEGGQTPSSPDAVGYIDGVTVERGKTSGSYFDGDSQGWDRLDRLETGQNVQVPVALADGVTGQLWLTYANGWAFLNGREITVPGGAGPIAVLPEEARPVYTPLYGILGRTGNGLFAHYSITTPGGAITLRQGSAHTVAMYLNASWPLLNPNPYL